MTLIQPSLTRLQRDPAISIALGEGLNAPVLQVLEPSERWRAWRVVYQAYFKKGLIIPLDDELWYDLRQADPQTITALIQRQREPLATISIVFDSPLHLPADDLYPNELTEFRARGRKLSEATCFAQLDNHACAYVQVLMALCRFTILTALTEPASDLIALVHPDHVSFYQNTFGFECFGPTKAFAKVKGALATPLHLSYQRMEAGLQGMLGTRIRKQLTAIVGSPEALDSPAFSNASQPPPLSVFLNADAIKAASGRFSWSEFLYFFDGRRHCFSIASTEQRAYLERILHPDDSVMKLVTLGRSN